MRKSVLIGLTGHQRHGKTETAKYLVENHGFIRMSFADELKAMARRIDPIVSYDIDMPSMVVAMTGGKTEVLGTPVRLHQAIESVGGDENLLKAQFPEYVRFLKALGTDGIRDVYEDFWVRLLIQKVGGLMKTDSGVRIVVDDVRFPNEADWFKSEVPHEDAELGLWRVSRPGHTVDVSHASEQWPGKLGEDRHLKNNGTLEDLGILIDAVVKPLLGEESSTAGGDK